MLVSTFASGALWGFVYGSTLVIPLGHHLSLEAKGTILKIESPRGHSDGISISDGRAELAGPSGAVISLNLRIPF